jgi:hypothetical protein
MTEYIELGGRDVLKTESQGSSEVNFTGSARDTYWNFWINT